MFVWTDIETTGLDPLKDDLLAIGMLITDDAFKEVARKEWYIAGNHDLRWRQACQAVRDMHTKSGVWDRCRAPDTPWLHETERLVSDWLRAQLGPPAANIKERPVMAGNTVHFDKAFISQHMPDVIKHLNYRLLDVSTLKVLALATVPGARAWEDSRGETAHTPLADLEGSLAELAHWRKVLSCS